MKEMEELLRGVARAFDHARHIGETLDETAWRILRESGLLRLMEAGDGLSESCVTDGGNCSICLQDVTQHASGCPVSVYCAAKAAMKEKKWRE